MPERLVKPMLTLAIATAMGITGCSRPPAAPHTPATAGPNLPVEVPVLWNVRSARRQTNFVRINLPAIITGMRIDIGAPKGPAQWIAESAPVTLYSSRILRGSVTGPAVEQLTGYPATPSDLGSYLVPLIADGQKSDGAAVAYPARFVVRQPMPVYMKVVVSALQEPGEYRFPVTITLPGRAAEEAALSVVVSEVALPTDPRVLAVATTTSDALLRVFPAAFRAAGKYPDRADPAQKPAIDALDVLVKTAQRQGVALFVEDFGPQVRVDEVGRVTLKWDGYDRLVQPYMDGSAFDDRVPLAAWLAPLAPRRISESPTQLRQYVAECAKHFTDKGWVATPAFMHPALVAPEGSPDAAQRDDVSRMVKLHMTRDMLAVTTPEAHVPQPRMWVVEDSDPRLPPAGAMATEESVREWPWMCAARSSTGAEEPIKGFVWRDSIAGAAELESRSIAGARPLFVATQSAAGISMESVTPSLRMLWLGEGLNDATMMGLLEQRADASVVQDLYAGIVGRTGLTTQSATDDSATATGPGPGYLYAGWPAEKATWDAMPAMLEKLVMASDPGSQGKIAGNDPLYMATKLWLAKTRRPVARVAEHTLALRSGREGDILDWNLKLLVENPVNAAVQMESRFALLPGDLDLAAQQGSSGGGRQSVEVPAFGVKELAMPITGQLDAIEAAPASSPLEVTERNGGALLQMPISLPLFRMKPTETPLKIDGTAGDWPTDATGRAYGAMIVGMHYLSRPDFINGAVRPDAAPAIARWTYDHDYLYVLVECPQTTVADERNNDWPIEQERWWGTDGVQVQIATAGPSKINPAGRIVQLGFKPGGAMLARVADVRSGEALHWTEGAPGGGGAVRYGTSIEKSDGRVRGYKVEAAIPRKWFESDVGPDSGKAAPPACRVNILRHRGSDLMSMSWTGPLVNDEDVGMMGLLVARP